MVHCGQSSCSGMYFRRWNCLACSGVMVCGREQAHGLVWASKTRFVTFLPTCQVASEIIVPPIQSAEMCAVSNTPPVDYLLPS